MSRIPPILGLMSLALSRAALADSAPLPVADTPANGGELFMGIDLALAVGPQTRSIVDVESANLVLEDGSRIARREVPGDGFRFRPALKVSLARVEIADLKVTRGYSMAADPAQDLIGQQIELQNYHQDQLSLRERQVMFSGLMANFKDGPGSAPPPGFERPRDPIGDAVADYSNYSMDNDRQLGANYLSKEVADESSEGFDTVFLAVDVRSVQPLEDVYAAAAIRLKSEGQLFDVLMVRPVGRVDSKARRVEMRQAGLPKGFKVLSSEVHFYRNEVELATSRSARLTPVTRQEAHQFALMQHLADHREQSTSARPIWNLAPAELLASGSAEQWDHPCEVDIDAEGRLTAIHHADQIPGPVKRVLQEVMFVPALEAGTAVASRTTVNLRDFL